MTKHVNLRLPDDVHAAAVAAADADDRSLNSWLIAVVRQAASLPRAGSAPSEVQRLSQT
jgi:predicted HicB family RNase H-like nuclease